MFYAKSTGGFYDTAIHGDNIPGDAVEITVEEHAALLAEQSAGKQIQADENGRPIAVSPPPPTIEALREKAWEQIKAERDRRKAGGVLVDGHWFHSDTDSRIQWLGTKDSARDILAAGGATADMVYVDGVALFWKTMAGDFAPVDVALAFAVVDATKVLDKRLYAVAEQKRIEMEASPDPAAYDELTDWPEAFEGVE